MLFSTWISFATPRWEISRGCSPNLVGMVKMGAKDIFDILEKIPLWKRMVATPDRLDALEKRLAEVEKLLNGKAPPEFCERCGERGMRLTSRRLAGDKPQRVREDWHCKDCGFETPRYPDKK